jgi:enoyl-[acyl-carrier protein] reductase/trans-2-enoyl-CoA reductase (NAD+)
MIITAKVRNNICMNSHPVGCAEDVRRQIAYVQEKGKISNGPKNVLVVGSSTGYGLSSRITAAFGSGAKTIGVAYEKEGSETKPGTAGYYNTITFEKEAKKAGLYAKSLNGDAFANEIKNQVIEIIKADLGKIDQVIYSLASPRRTDPVDGVSYMSCLKPIGEVYKSKTIDPQSREVKNVCIDPAVGDDIKNTVKVMGGEDWLLWIKALDDAGVLADNATTVAYSYIGPEITMAIYREGTIGRAKEHLEKTAAVIREQFKGKKIRAYVSVNKALATKASAVIPVVPLYISLLYKVMKAKGIHEGCIEQIYRLYKDFLTTGTDPKVDEEGRIRIDDWEMRDDVQKEVADLWDMASTENIARISDIEGYWNDFLQAHGFGIPGVDYDADVDPS